MNILQILPRCNPNKANDILSKYPPTGRGEGTVTKEKSQLDHRRLEDKQKRGA